MTSTTVLTILGSLGFPTIIAALIAFFGTRRTLAANQPKTEAEADQVQASANAQNLTAQSSVIATLVSENVRLSERVAVLENKSAAAEKRYGDLVSAHDELLRMSVLMRSHIERADAWIARTSYPDANDPPPRPFSFPS